MRNLWLAQLLGTECLFGLALSQVAPKLIAGPLKASGSKHHPLVSREFYSMMKMIPDDSLESFHMWQRHMSGSYMVTGSYRIILVCDTSLLILVFSVIS